MTDEQILELAEEYGYVPRDRMDVLQFARRVLQAAIAAPAQEPAGLPDLLPPMNIRTDRDMLNYLHQAFENEMSVCERCHHSESTRNMDSASFLRDYLDATHPA